jgi:hypothetical protein
LRLVLIEVAGTQRVHSLVQIVFADREQQRTRLGSGSEDIARR